MISSQCVLSHLQCLWLTINAFNTDLRDDLRAGCDSSGKVGREVEVGGGQGPNLSVNVGAEADDPLLAAGRLVGRRVHRRPGFESFLKSAWVGLGNDARLKFSSGLCDGLALVDECREVRWRRVVSLRREDLDTGRFRLNVLQTLEH